MYFKISFLNSLRDELWLTLTMQKATLFVFLYLGIPAGALGIGIANGIRSPNLLQSLRWGATLFLLAFPFAWALPRVLWMMLIEFYRRGWFLQTTPQTVPTMSIEEYSKRLAAFDRGEMWRVGIAIASVFAWGITCWLLGKVVDRASLPEWIKGVIVLSFLGTLPALLWLQSYHHRRMVNQHGLACLNCHREITNAAGGPGVPSEGLCRHCGAKVIED